MTEDRTKRILELVELLDREIPRGGYAVVANNTDELEIVSDRQGFLRLGHLLLRAAVSDSLFSNGRGSVFNLQIADLFGVISEYQPVAFTLVDDMMFYEGKRWRIRGESPLLVRLTITAALVGLLSLIAIGAYTVVQWVGR